MCVIFDSRRYACLVLHMSFLKFRTGNSPNVHNILTLMLSCWSLGAICWNISRSIDYAQTEPLSLYRRSPLSSRGAYLHRRLPNDRTGVPSDIAHAYPEQRRMRIILTGLYSTGVVSLITKQDETCLVAARRRSWTPRTSRRVWFCRMRQNSPLIETL